jgi:hypothetical protein
MAQPAGHCSNFKLEQHWRSLVPSVVPVELMRDGGFGSYLACAVTAGRDEH